MDLFSNSESVSVVPSADRPALSKAQKTFNSLIAKIEKQRLLLAEWEAAVPRYQQRHLAVLTPLITESTRLWREFVFGLDRACSFKPLGKADRVLLEEMVRELARELAGEGDDAEMKALYNRYGGDFDQEKSAALSGMKSLFESSLGMDLGDGLDMSDPEAFMEQMRAKLEREEEAHQEARRAAKPQRAKTAKQRAKEEMLLAEEQRVSQSLREIYRKLVSALHPDRELDADERVRKTKLMQQVNQAYERKDLLALLELQLKVEHIDQAALNSLSEERLGYFNKLLKEQLGEIEAQVFQITDEVRHNLGLRHGRPLAPVSMMRELDADIAEIRAYLRGIEADMKAIRDAVCLKAWLKRARREWRVREDDDFSGYPF